MKTSSLLIASMTLFSACTSTQKQEEQAGTHSLVVVYSQTGATQKVAEQIQKLTGADLEVLKCTEPYDGDFQQTIARWQKEMQDSILPSLEPIAVDLSKYDTLYVGYPVWGGTYASPMATFLSENNLDGKVIIPFCTFGSGGLNTSSAALAEALPNAQMIPGYGVRNARIQAIETEVEDFLVRSGIIAGEVEALSEFGEEVPVDENTAEIFRVACSGYQMPLGNAVSCCSRELGEATEYCFLTDQNAHIYVLDHHKLKISPEFTQVVR